MRMWHKYISLSKNTTSLEYWSSSLCVVDSRVKVFRVDTVRMLRHHHIPRSDKFTFKLHIHSFSCQNLDNKWWFCWLINVASCWHRYLLLPDERATWLSRQHNFNRQHTVIYLRKKYHLTQLNIYPCLQDVTHTISLYSYFCSLIALSCEISPGGHCRGRIPRASHTVRERDTITHRGDGG